MKKLSLISLCMVFQMGYAQQQPKISTAKPPLHPGALAAIKSINTDYKEKENNERKKIISVAERTVKLELKKPSKQIESLEKRIAKMECAIEQLEKHSQQTESVQTLTGTSLLSLVCGLESRCNEGDRKLSFQQGTLNHLQTSLDLIAQKIDDNTRRIEGIEVMNKLHSDSFINIGKTMEHLKEQITCMGHQMNSTFPHMERLRISTYAYDRALTHYKQSATHTSDSTYQTQTAASARTLVNFQGTSYNLQVHPNNH